MFFLDSIRGWLEHSQSPEGCGFDGAGPENQCAMFPLGDEIIGRRADILGGERVLHRYTILLVNLCSRDPQEGDTEPYYLMKRMAGELADYWQKQAHVTAVYTEKEHLAALSKEGRARYEMKLIVEYTTEA